MFDKLKSEFDRSQVSWRAQTLTKSGDKALALAYIDARDVMNRLDEVCGPDGWQSEHFDLGNGKTGCRIGILCKEQWIWKSDGAGDTAIEADKGAISDALKRAAVSWGIGRYLYDLDAVWVPCTTWEKNGKKMFQKFTADPWSFIRSKPASNQSDTGTFKPKWVGKLGKSELGAAYKKLAMELDCIEEIDGINPFLESDEFKPIVLQLRVDDPTGYQNLLVEIKKLKTRILEKNNGRDDQTIY